MKPWSLMHFVALSAIGMTCGALFAGWNLLWGALTPLFALALPLQYLLFAGTWVIAGPLAGLVIRRRGAALAGELIAASVSFLLASQWSLDALFSGAVQGLGAELVFALVGYRVWRWPVVVAAGAASGVGMALHDLPLYFAGVDAGYAAALAAAMVLSGALLGGGGAALMHRAVRHAKREGVAGLARTPRAIARVPVVAHALNHRLAENGPVITARTDLCDDRAIIISATKSAGGVEHEKAIRSELAPVAMPGENQVASPFARQRALVKKTPWYFTLVTS